MQFSCSFQLVKYCLLCTKIYMMKICIQDGDPPVNGDFAIIANDVASEPLTWGATALDVRDSLEKSLQGIARDIAVERFGTAQVGFNYSISYQRYATLILLAPIKLSVSRSSQFTWNSTADVVHTAQDLQHLSWCVFSLSSQGFAD